MDCAKPQYTNELTQVIMGFHKSTLVARGANTQLDPNCASAPPATNVDLFAYFAKRLSKSSSITIYRAGA